MNEELEQLSDEARISLRTLWIDDFYYQFNYRFLQQLDSLVRLRLDNIVSPSGIGFPCIPSLRILELFGHYSHPIHRRLPAGLLKCVSTQVPGLKSLTLRQVSFLTNTPSPFGGHMPALKYLRLQNLNTSPYWVENALRFCPNLTSLVLEVASSSVVPGCVWFEVFEFPQMCSLKHIEIANYDIGQRFPILSDRTIESLQRLATLHTLCLININWSHGRGVRSTLKLTEIVHSLSCTLQVIVDSRKLRSAERNPCNAAVLCKPGDSLRTVCAALRAFVAHTVCLRMESRTW